MTFCTHDRLRKAVQYAAVQLWGHDSLPHVTRGVYDQE